MPPGGVAVIADNVEVFLAEHLGFSGQLFDSSFELRNISNILTLANPDKDAVDTIAYTSENRRGNGNSLQRAYGELVYLSPPPGIHSQTQIVILDSAFGNGTGQITIGLPSNILENQVGLERSSDLLQWTPISGSTTSLPNGRYAISFSDDNAIPARFFRIRVNQ